MSTTLIGLEGAATAAPSTAHRPIAQDLAIVASVAAAAIHAIEIRTHLEWWTPSGWLFIALAVLQAALAASLIRTRVNEWVLLTAIAGTVGVIVLYVWSRTWGLAFSPGIPVHGGPRNPGKAIVPNKVREVGFTDTVALIAELATVLCACTLLTTRNRRHVTNLLTAGAAVLAALVIWHGAF